MDSGAWRATVNEVAKSRTRLSDSLSCQQQRTRGRKAYIMGLAQTSRDLKQDDVGSYNRVLCSASCLQNSEYHQDNWPFVSCFYSRDFNSLYFITKCSHLANQVLCSYKQNILPLVMKEGYVQGPLYISKQRGQAREGCASACSLHSSLLTDVTHTHPVCCVTVQLPLLYCKFKGPSLWLLLLLQSTVKSEYVSKQ